MTAQSKRDAGGALPVWERPEPASRPAPSPLSREKIVRAAVAIADEGGLAAVSLRKVAASLDAGPMRLYGYVANKEELLELMMDEVYGEMPSAKPVAEDWRGAMRIVAHRIRGAAREHGWFVELLGSRPHLGPNALVQLDAAFAALSGTPGFEASDEATQALRTINAYVIGAVRIEASELRAELESGMDKTEWQTTMVPYMHRMMATGRFPNLARVIGEITNPSADVLFDHGLDCVLDGIAARLPR